MNRTSFPRPSFQTRHLRALIYRMGGTEFATEVSQIQEIVRPNRLARLANLPNNVEGVLKRRGRLVPIVDLRKRLNLPVNLPTPETCAVIVKLPIGPVGFVVDAALALRWIKTAEVEAPSSILIRIEQAFIQGLALQEDRIIVMLDLMQVLSASDQADLAGVTANA